MGNKDKERLVELAKLIAIGKAENLEKIEYEWLLKNIKKSTQEGEKKKTAAWRLMIENKLRDAERGYIDRKEIPLLRDALNGFSAAG